MSIGALAAAASGLSFQGLKVDSIADDLANMDTTGFKKSVLYGKDRGYRTIQSAGSPTSAEGTISTTGIYIGMGVTPAGLGRIMEQGDVGHTDSPLDVMIQGEGFFEIMLPSGDVGYTRDGRFQLDNNRHIVTLEDYKVKPDLTIPVNTTSVDINKEGQVYANIPGQVPILVGQFELSVFANPRGLEPIGAGLYKETAASGTATTGHAGAIGYGAVLQYALESSNVKPVVALTELIEANRAYAMNTKTINAVEEMFHNLESMMR